MLFCNCTSCCYNFNNGCNKDNITVSTDGENVICKSKKKETNDNILVEFAKELCSNHNISCSQEDCIYNIHYSCKAKMLDISRNEAKCQTYYKFKL